MTSAYVDPLLDTLSWIKKCKPAPTTADFHTQFGVFCEEVGETLTEVSAANHETAMLIVEAKEAMERLGTHLKGNDHVIVIKQEHRKDFLDGLNDVIVTAVTTAYSQGMDIVGSANEVNRANFSKFVDGNPIFDVNGKVAKGPNFEKADLTSFV